MSYQSEVLSDSPEVYLRLGETVGATTAVDISGNGNNGTVNGSITFGVTGAIPANTAATFATGYLSLGSLGFSGANAWTINSWVKRNGDTMQTIFGSGSAGANGTYLSVFMSVQGGQAGQVYVGGNGNDWGTAGGAIPADSDYHMVTVVYDGGTINATTLHIYVDGVAQTVTLRAGGAGGGGWDGAYNLGDTNNRVGSNIENPSNHLNSDLDEFSLVHSALNSTRIGEIFASAGDTGIDSGTLTLSARTATSVTLDYGIISGGLAPYSSQLQVSATSGGAFSNVGSPFVGANISFPAATGLTTGEDYFFRVVTTDDNSDTVTSSEFAVYMMTSDQIAHLAASPGVMYHHGLYTWGATQNGDEDEDLYNPTNLDVGQWLNVAKSFGAKAASITTRHHDGFCLYPSAHTPHTIAESTWYQADPTNRDVVKLFTDAARERGMRVGLYYSVWDKRWESDNPGWTSGEYTDYVIDQLTELMGGTYGEIEYLWLDGWGWQVGYSNVNYASVYAAIKALNPNCIVVENNHENDFTHTDIISNEEPFDDPADAINILPSQTTETIRTDGQWQWVAPGNQTLHSGATIASNIARDAARNSVYHLNLSPDDTGLIPAPQVAVALDVLNDSTPPSRVLGASAQQTTSTSVTLRWKAGTDEDLKGYRILRSTSENSGFTEIAAPYAFDNPHTSTVVTGLTPGTHYYFRLVAVDWSDNESEESSNAPYYPLEAEVEDGLEYGPNGEEFTGTMEGGGGGAIVVEGSSLGLGFSCNHIAHS